MILKGHTSQMLAVEVEGIESIFDALSSLHVSLIKSFTGPSSNNKTSDAIELLQVGEPVVPPRRRGFGPFDQAREMIASEQYTRVLQTTGPVLTELAEGEDAIDAVGDMVSGVQYVC